MRMGSYTQLYAANLNAATFCLRRLLRREGRVALRRGGAAPHARAQARLARARGRPALAVTAGTATGPPFPRALYC